MQCRVHSALHSVQITEAAAGTLEAFKEVSTGDHRIEGTVLGIYDTVHYR